MTQIRINIPLSNPSSQEGEEEGDADKEGGDVDKEEGDVDNEESDVHEEEKGTGVVSVWPMSKEKEAEVQQQQLPAQVGAGEMGND